MKKLLTTLIVSMFCVAFNSASRAQSTSSQPRASKTSKSAIRFHTLSRYKDDRWSTIFRDREVAPALRALLKKDYGLLRDSLGQANYPEDSDSFMDKNGVLKLEGGVKGLYTIMEAALIIEPGGNIYAAILDEGKQFLYFTNDQKYLDKLPPPIEQWRIGVESRRSQPSEVPKLPVVFKNK